MISKTLINRLIVNSFLSISALVCSVYWTN